MASIAERERLHGIPSGRIHNVLSDRQYGTLIGNAMSVNVLERLLCRLLPAAGLCGRARLHDRWEGAVPAPICETLAGGDPPRDADLDDDGDEREADHRPMSGGEPFAGAPPPPGGGGPDTAEHAMACPGFAVDPRTLTAFRRYLNDDDRDAVRCRPWGSSCCSIVDSDATKAFIDEFRSSPGHVAQFAGTSGTVTAGLGGLVTCSSPPRRPVRMPSVSRERRAVNHFDPSADIAAVARPVRKAERDSAPVANAAVDKEPLTLSPPISSGLTTQPTEQESLSSRHPSSKPAAPSWR